MQQRWGADAVLGKQSQPAFAIENIHARRMIHGVAAACQFLLLVKNLEFLGRTGDFVGIACQPRNEG